MSECDHAVDFDRRSTHSTTTFRGGNNLALCLQGVASYRFKPKPPSFCGIDTTDSVVDDDRTAGESLEIALNRDTDTFDVETVTTPRDGLARLSTSEFDCRISGYELPSMDGVTFLERVRERDPDIPFILFTASGSETIASRAISASVTEYIRKDAEQGGIGALAGRVREVTESDQTSQEIEYDKANFEDLIEAFLDFVLVIDDTGRYVDLVAAGNSLLLYDDPTQRRIVVRCDRWNNCSDCSAGSE